MHYALLGWHDEGPTLRLDHRRFSYAGKFVMSNTGKAVAHEGPPRERRPDWPPGAREGAAEDVVAAVSFNEDRTDPDALWLRYVTVRADRRGEGVGPRLCAFVTRRARERGYGVVRIAVNNPFAYEALYKAGFGFTGEQTGIAELVLSHPGPDDGERYRSGLDVFRDRDLSDAEESFLAERTGADPPPSPPPRSHSRER